MTEFGVCEPEATSQNLASSSTLSHDSSSPTASVSSSISCVDDFIEKNNENDNRPICTASSVLDCETKRTNNTKMTRNESASKLAAPKMDPTSVRVAVRFKSHLHIYKSFAYSNRNSFSICKYLKIMNKNSYF